jgi:hypothetical protein
MYVVTHPVLIPKYCNSECLTNYYNLIPRHIDYLGKDQNLPSRYGLRGKI